MTGRPRAVGDGAIRRVHPEIAIEFETDHHEVDPARRAFDVWIAFVAGVPPTVHSEVLFEETLVPVCSPAFLASRGRPGHPADLHGWPLLYDLAWEEYWAHWFSPAERPARRTCPGPRGTACTR